MVPELAGLYRRQLFPDPLVNKPGGTKKSSGRGFRIEGKDVHFQPFTQDEV